jgi:molecular chaperone GrpE
MTELKKTTPKKRAKKKAKNKNLEIEGYKEEIKQLKDTALRSHADLINFKRRTLDDIQSNKLKIKTGIFAKFITTLDDLKLTLNSLPKDKQFKDWVTGMEIIIKNFEKSLNNEGLSEINPIKGDDFDPSKHEALSIENTKDSKLDGKISQTIKNGYSIENSIIRPAQVILSNYIKKNSK